MLRNFFTTNANTWWNLYASDAPPEKVLEALAARDKRGATILMRTLADRDCEAAGREMLEILEKYLKQGVSSTKILELLEMRDDIGANIFHSLAHAHDDMMTMRWQTFMHTILDGDVANQKKNLSAVYEILNNKAAYYSNFSIADKYTDRLFENDIYVSDAHAVLVLKLAQLGLPRSKVDALLEKDNGTLAPIFWEKIDEKIIGEIVNLFEAGFFLESEYVKFVEAKEEILEYICEMTDVSQQRQSLNNVLDANHPLGKLFLMKSRYEFRDLNVSHGLLQKAFMALNALSFKQSAAQLPKLSLLGGLTPVMPVKAPEVPSPIVIRLE